MILDDSMFKFIIIKNDRQAAYQYGVKQEGGRWVLEEGSDKADLIVANGDNVSEKKFTLRIKDANKKD